MAAAVTCSVQNCNVDETSDQLFPFPKYKKIRELWENAVNMENWKATKTARMCANHFEKNCFETEFQVLKSMNGNFQTTLRLKKDAVPTIFKRRSTRIQQVRMQLCYD